MHPRFICMDHLKKELVRAYREEESYWRQRSREFWLRGGDKNTRFFHDSVKYKRARKRLEKLFDEHGIPQRSEAAKGQVATDYFDKLFTSTNPSSFEEFFQDFTPRVTPEMNEALIKEISKEEVKEALFSVKASSAPGPDGMSGLFFQHYWSTVGDQVTKEVQDFFRTGILPTEWNYTHLCLIPKVENPTSMANLRPISLCSVLYKVVSKVLVKRLQPFLALLVSESQSAFVSERLISDNILIAHELVHGLKTHPEVATEFMALKSDMSKVYDRVEWSYIKALFAAMGFHQTWTDWIMACISSVTFSVLINDQPLGLVTPHRGLRQGDPLSPFLFVLCTEGLSHLLNQAERNGLLTGISFGPEGPSISHLLFADDSLFLCKANVEESKVLKQILEKYGQATGQEINVNKSSITFGDRVDLQKRTQIQETFQIFSEGGAGTYLGLPECFSGSKIELLNYIKDKLKARMSGWFAKTLSQGGKEILLKAVALAMPIYAMSCFRLPKKICANLISAMIQYWWSSTENTRKIPWISWEKLCLSKELGGIGFKDLELFNQALLSKQAWRILTDPTSLVARLLKSRYFYDGDFLQAKIGARPSYAWKSMLFGRDLLTQGLKRQIGNGEDVSVWMDQWMKDSEGMTRAPWRKNVTFEVNLKVKDLMHTDRNEWNHQVLEDLFTHTDAEAIQKIHFLRNSKDSWIWKFNKSGDFTVKSAYWLACEKKISVVRNEAKRLPSINGLKAEAWRVKSEPKIRTFIWKALSNALPVEDCLASKGLRVDGRCQTCGYQGESVNHVLFMCTFARQTWALSNLPLPENGFDDNSRYANFDHLLRLDKNRVVPGEVRRSWPWIVWNIWKRRNKLLFDGLMINAQETVNKGREEAEAWFFALTCEKEEVETVESERRGVVERWKAPGLGWIKCNIGVFWCKRRKIAGAAWVVRDYEGKVLLNSRRTFSGMQSLDDAKFCVVSWAMVSMQEHRLDKVWFGCDDRSLVEAVASPKRWPAIRYQSGYLISLLGGFSNSKLILESKRTNQGANMIAASVSSPHLRQSYVAVGTPDWLDEFFTEEATRCRL